jgi:hypothetical protein
MKKVTKLFFPKAKFSKEIFIYPDYLREEFFLPVIFVFMFVITYSVIGRTEDIILTPHECAIFKKERKTENEN